MAASLVKWLMAGIFLLTSGKPAEADRHPLYISVTEIKHNAKDRILELSCKIFTNDFEAVLGKQAKAKVDLSDASGKKAAEKLITAYIQQHLQLKVDGKPVVLQFAGSEQEADGTWSFFQVNDVSAVKRLDVVNSILYDGFEQEMNIMHVTVGGVRKSFRLNYPDTRTYFEF